MEAYSAGDRQLLSFAYSAFTSFGLGMSGSASFQRVRKSCWALFALVVCRYPEAHQLPRGARSLHPHQGQLCAL